MFLVSAGKEKRIGVYANSAPSAPAAANGGVHGTHEKAQFEAQVVRIWSGDQIVRFHRRLVHRIDQIS